jgi:hypothetical protein
MGERSHVLLDVALRVLVLDLQVADRMLRLERHETDGDVVAEREARVPAEVGEVLALFLGHVVVVRDPRVDDRLPPGVRADLMCVGRLHGVADLVVVLDSVLDLVFDVVGVRLAGAELQQMRVEEALLGLGVHLEEDREPLPQGRQRLGGVDGVGGVGCVAQLVQVGEHPPLLVVLEQDHLGDVHVTGIPAPGADDAAEAAT